MSQSVWTQKRFISVEKQFIVNIEVHTTVYKKSKAIQRCLKNEKLMSQFTESR